MSSRGKLATCETPSLGTVSNEDSLVTMAAENHSYRWLRITFWCAAIALGAADTWATRNTMNADGVAYLDMGDAYWRADWHMAINAYWSPLYSWLAGLALKLLKPSAYWEYPVVHLVNFLVYLAALASFEFFLRAFIADRRQSVKDPAEGEGATLPEWAWWTLGYSLFIWTSLVLISVRIVNPDMCVAALVFLASGLLLRMRCGAATRRTFVLFGVVLGFGYLAKAVMFPLAFVFLAVALFSLGSVRKAAPQVLLSALVFLAIGGPFIFALSRAKGRLTFGDSGKITYTAYVDSVRPFFPSGREVLHPVRKIFGAPPAYEFAQPIGGAYPLSYDNSYWQDGIRPHLNLKGQLLVFEDALARYALLLLSPFLELNVSAGFFVLLLLAPQPVLCIKRAAANWRLIIPALAPFGLYSLMHVEYRFFGAFVCVLWLASFSGVRLPSSLEFRRLISFVVVAIVVTTGVLLGRSTLSNLALGRRLDTRYWEAAQALNEKGIVPGDQVAAIARETLGEGGAFVARLAGIRITAQVEKAPSFWQASPSTQSQVIEAFRKTGVKAVLAYDDPPGSVPGPAWERLGNTRYYVDLLGKSAH